MKKNNPNKISQLVIYETTKIMWPICLSQLTIAVNYMYYIYILGSARKKDKL